MGIFSDRCQTLIDPTTNRALVGDALRAAQANVLTPRCGATVRKSARFCSKCGGGAPGGWWQCPTCRKWVGNESQYCWNCQTPLYPERRGALAGGSWQRRPGVLAERFEVGDVRKVVEKGLTIEEGTRALLLDAGRLVDVLEPGRHTLESLARKINHWGDPPPRTVILVDQGDLILPIRFEGLRSAEELEVRYYGEVIVRLDLKAGKALLENLIKEKTEISVEELVEMLASELKHTVEAFAVSTTIDDLVKDPERRLRFEDQLRDLAGECLARRGLTLVRISAAEFYGRAYEELRQKAGDIEVRRREAELTQRLREINLTDEMGRFQSEHALFEYAQQLAQERGLSMETRQSELAALQQRFRQARERSEKVHEIDLTDLEREAARVAAEADAATQVRIAKEALELKRQKLTLKREHLEESAKILEGRDFPTLIALIDDPERRQQLLAMHRSMQLAGRPPAEILALASADNPQALHALRDILALEGQQQATAAAQREQLLKDHSVQLERIFAKAMDSMATAAAPAGNSTTINK